MNPNMEFIGTLQKSRFGRLRYTPKFRLRLRYHGTGDILERRSGTQGHLQHRPRGFGALGLQASGLGFI